MRKAFYTAIRKYAKDLAKHSDHVAGQFDGATIHKLRTTFKKLRALLRWQKVDKKFYKPVRKIYQLAGEIRIIQVAKEMLVKETTTMSAFNTWLSSRLTDKKKEWNEQYDEKIFHRLQHWLEHLHVPMRSNKKFFSERLKEMHATINAV